MRSSGVEIKSFWNTDTLQAELRKSIFDYFTQDIAKGSNESVDQISQPVDLPANFEYPNAPGREEALRFTQLDCKPCRCAGTIEAYTPPGGTWKDRCASLQILDIRTRMPA